MADAFTVKDSGKREEYPTGMRRDTQEGKPRYDLTLPEKMTNDMLTRWAIHMTKGAEKYGSRNWELASTREEAERFKASAFRHFIQWWKGDRDEDHAAATFFNIQAFEYVQERLQCKHLPAEFDYVCARCFSLVKQEER